jgi:type IV pilus assembly protein PilA
LIELMIVVAIVGILSLLGAYGVRKYIANAKTSEARNSLGRMASGAVIAYENEQMSENVLPAGDSTAVLRTLCNTASATVPSSATAIQGRKYQSNATEWSVDAAVSGTGFSCLHFTVDVPQYYLYGYRASGTSSVGDSFTASANGDLNGDGILSTFSIVGAIGSDFVIHVAPNMQEVLPDE